MKARRLCVLSLFSPVDLSTRLFVSFTNKTIFENRICVINNKIKNAD